ncbi:hypothetical protein GQ53DRAFT_868295 [Thozetella sp. PMI_491]|nr:hypothetical protein GQ53DRAFT_868295 [Thozetella sp. PMI_491]
MENQEGKAPISAQREFRQHRRHRKSRNGCSQCRRRRVKCDEGRPCCSSCHQRNELCDYPVNRKVGSSSTVIARSGMTPSDPAPQTRSITSNASLPVLPAANPLPNRHLELLILHNFTVYTCKALTGNNSPQMLELWSVRIPKLAIAYEPLLNAVLAFSGLHMLALQAENDALRACRNVYLENAVTHYHATLGASTPLSPEITDATYFTSVLLLADALASVRKRELEPYTPPSNWLGIGQIVRSVLDALAKSVVLFSEAQAKRFPYLLEPRTADGSQHLATPPETEETAFAYRDMASFLGTLEAAIQAGEPHHSLIRRFLFSATIVQNPFVEQLEVKLPKALIMLAHFWAMAARISLEVGGLWWIDAAPWREVKAIQRNVPMEWQHLLQWPLRMLADVEVASPGPL